MKREIKKKNEIKNEIKRERNNFVNRQWPLRSAMCIARTTLLPINLVILFAAHFIDDIGLGFRFVSNVVRQEHGPWSRS